MKETIAVSALLLATVCLFSCGEKKQPEDGGSFWEQFGVVADREVINGDTVIVFDSGMVKQRSTVPVELLVDGFEVVKMDNSKEDALIGGRLTLVGISSNYIGVHHYQFFAFKLFEKEGRYLRDIGSIGQGPGEYNAIQDCYMDEENDRIYLLTGYNSTEVLVYDFNGNHYPPVRLAPSCNVSGGSKMKLRPGKDEIIFTRSLVGRGTGFYHVWVQDWDGNFIQGIRDTEYYPERANSESTTTHLHTENVELFRLGSNNAEDYLYHY
ncbi:MAG: 6-bladed beta-propeller, partial [Tannerellaceae bacterium]|nr:6-bladed beta-propeller [Tannerellaceae bacterium]